MLLLISGGFSRFVVFVAYSEVVCGFHLGHVIYVSQFEPEGLKTLYKNIPQDVYPT